MNGQRGVTLIEVLIAVSLLSLLSVAVVMALNVGLTATDRANNRFLENRKVVNAQRILEEEVAGMVPVIADCVPDPQEPARNPMPFFQGEPQTMRFVSTYSLNGGSRGRAQVLEFQVIRRPQGDGVRLVVNEWPYGGPEFAGRYCQGYLPDPATQQPFPGFRPVQVGPNSFVLADELASCRFQFRRRLPAPLFEQWADRFPGPGWPTGVRIDMRPLRPDAASVLPVPLIVPVRVRREMEFQYQDQR